VTTAVGGLSEESPPLSFFAKDRIWALFIRSGEVSLAA
jgi:hypothetical protein